MKFQFIDLIKVQNRAAGQALSIPPSSCDVRAVLTAGGEFPLPAVPAPCAGEGGGAPDPVFWGRGCPRENIFPLFSPVFGYAEPSAWANRKKRHKILYKQAPGVL